MSHQENCTQFLKKVLLTPTELNKHHFKDLENIFCRWWWYKANLRRDFCSLMDGNVSGFTSCDLISSVQRLGELVGVAGIWLAGRAAAVGGRRHVGGCEPTGISHHRWQGVFPLERSKHFGAAVQATGSLLPCPSLLKRLGCSHKESVSENALWKCRLVYLVQLVTRLKAAQGNSEGTVWEIWPSEIM